MEEEVKSLNDYLNIARRRKYIIALTFFVLLVISFIVAMILPPVYQSEATILIEQQHIPTELIKSTVTTYADERIQLIQQQVMTVANLTKIMDKYGLYQQQRKKLSPTELVDLFKENTQVEPINADVISQGRTGKAVIAFKLIWNDRSPELAQKVSNELVTLFLNENVRARTQRAEETTTFLAEEVEKLKLEIQKIENTIAEYKQKYSESLPELLPVNLSTISRLESELQQLNLQEKMLAERRISLGSQLMVTNPAVVAPSNATSPPVPSTLDELLATETDLLSKYSASHPDVQRVRRQMKMLQSQSAKSDAGADAELAQARQALIDLRKKYSENHPDVKVMQKRVAELESNSRSQGDDSAASRAQNVNNPVYLQLKSELDIAQIELQNIKTQRVELQQKLQTLEANVSQSHQVERGYYELMRDLDSNKAKYQELKSKQLQAKLSQTLEEEQKGESFTLIEPPQVPKKPIKPNRLKLLFLGFIASIGGGLGMGFLKEIMDGGIRGHRMLAHISGIEPLVVIPYIKNQADLTRTRKHLINFWVTTAILLISLIIAVHFLYMPLDILGYKVWQRLGLL